MPMVHSRNREARSKKGVKYIGKWHKNIPKPEKIKLKVCSVAQDRIEKAGHRNHGFLHYKRF